MTPSYQRIRSQATGGTDKQSVNFFGFGTYGDILVPTSSTLSMPATAGLPCIYDCESLTLSASATLQPSTYGASGGGPSVTIIRIRGDLTLATGATITSNGASAVASAINFQMYGVNGLTGILTERASAITYTTPTIGAGGGAGGTGGAASPGSSGTGGSTAGGGGGGGGNGGAFSAGGLGATGTAFSGGPGAGGGGQTGANPGLPGGANGGAGGAGGLDTVNSFPGNGGAGNPGGAPGLPTIDGDIGGTGTGAVVIILVAGNVNVVGSIKSNGFNGGKIVGTGNPSGAMGGGGSGAGRTITCYAGTFTNTGSIVSTGGLAGAGQIRGGGAGGAGSVTVQQIAL